MTVLAIRQSGGANIISIPRAILNVLGLHVGSVLNLSIEDQRIVLTPQAEELTLDALLTGSPKKRLRATPEDKAWMQMPLQGKEF